MSSVSSSCGQGDLVAVEAFPAGVREEIRTRYLGLLHDDDSPLLDNPQIHSQLVAQLDSVLDAVAPLLAWRVEQPTGLELSADIGGARARSGVSPAQSLQAATLIFEAALPAVVSRMQHLERADAPRRAALALNRAILKRMAAAAMNYVDVLLSAAHANAHLERARLSRELHDVTAPNVALALQSLELHDIYRPDSPGLAADKLSDARNSLHHALTLLRSTAGELRHDVASTGLIEALRRYIDSMAASCTVSFGMDGADRLQSLSGAYCEETFLIVREALRNAATHANAAHIEVTLTASEGTLQATVSDDGQGFDPTARTDHSDGVGLTSMRERAELLSATLQVDSSPQAGTCVRVTIPLPRRTTTTTAGKQP